MIFDYISRASSLPFEQQVAQNFTSELQWSPNFLVGIIFAGEVSVHYEMHRRDFKVHDIFFFMPMQTFTFVSASPDARVLFISIDTAYLTQLCPELPRISLGQNHLTANLGNETYVALCRDFSAIIFNNLKVELCTRMRLLSAATHMANVIFEAFGIVAEAGPKSAVTAADRSREILEYISAHYADRISVNDIAGHLGLHPQYFSTYFHKQFRTNFVDYLTTYRINRSLYELSYTDESILNIALNCGFNSHKTYSAAFKRLYECTPMDYRRTSRHSDNKAADDQAIPGGRQEDVGVFSYFRQFLQEDSGSQDRFFVPTQAKKQESIELDALSLSPSSKNFTNIKMISVGRALSILRSEVQLQIRLAKKEIGFDFIRLRDIFNDDLYVYYEDENREPIYSWQSLDNVFDFILSIGATPFPEIGYMPNLLASKRQYAGVQYHPNVSMPKSYEAWGDLIRAFLIHYIERYGLSEVQKWYFDFWTSPDLKMKNAYWNESQEEFFLFYKATYDAFMSIDRNLKLASANFSTITGFDWYESFFQFCFANHIYPAYVSIHAYGSEPTTAEAGHDTFLKVRTEDYSITDSDYIQKNLAKVHQIMNRTGFRSLDVIVADWNLTFLPKDLIRDTCYMGPFICHTYIRNLNLTKAMCFWSLSDIHEDAFPESRLFTGGPGMLDYHGLRKASYNTMSLLTKLGSRILATGDNYIFTQEGSRFQLLIYNLAEFDRMFTLIDQSAMDETHRYQIYNEDSLYVSAVIALPKGTYYVKRSEVNRKYGSAYDLWNDMGAPAVLHKELEDYLRETSVPHITFTVENVEQTLLLEEEVPSHGVLLVELIPKG